MKRVDLRCCWAAARNRKLVAAVIMSWAFLAGCETPVIDLIEPPVHTLGEVEGSGREAHPGGMVTINYRILLPDGSEVLSAQGYQFQVGRGTVIAGVDRAVVGMRAGGRRTVEIPPHLHWGRKGYADKVPPNTRLTAEIHLTRVR